MGLTAALRRRFGLGPMPELEPHAFVGSITMTPPTTRVVTVGEPLVIRATRCHRADCGRPSRDPIHQIAEDGS